MISSFRAASLAGVLLAGSGLSLHGAAKQREVISTDVVVNAGGEGCAVEVDGVAAGKTDGKGVLVLHDVDPSDHYLHLRCPGDPQETAYFVSPVTGEKVEVRRAAEAAAGDAGRSPLQAAEAKIQLRRDVQQAVRLRAQGELDNAVRLLHEASRMDPENSDLHRELGITFLLNRDWKRARVEMLEALRHDPIDADAHNGLGYALEKLGELDAALKEYRTATQLEPDNASYRQHYLEGLGKLAVKQAERKK
jgi:hypothetical protein